MTDADELGQFGAARALTAVSERLPPLHVLGWGLLAVGLVLVTTGMLLPATLLTILGALVVLPGVGLLTLGYGRGDVGLDTQ